MLRVNSAFCRTQNRRVTIPMLELESWHSRAIVVGEKVEKFTAFVFRAHFNVKMIRIIFVNLMRNELSYARKVTEFQVFYIVQHSHIFNGDKY